MTAAGMLHPSYVSRYGPEAATIGPPGRPPGAGHRVLSPGRYDILKAEALSPRASTDPAGEAIERWT